MIAGKKVVKEQKDQVYKCVRERVCKCVRRVFVCVTERDGVQVLKAGTVAERWAQLAFLSVIAPRRKC